MDVGFPLQALLPPVAARCVMVLADPGAAGGLSGRAVARRVGASSAAVARSALLGLVRLGVVSREASGREVRYGVNREHLLWPALAAAMAAPDLFRVRVREWVGDSVIPDASVLLYGSSARGQARPDSDLDVLVVFPDGLPLAVRDEFSAGLSDAVGVWTGRRVEIYDLTVSDLVEHVAAGEAIVASWRAEAQLLAGSYPAGLLPVAV